MDYNDLEKKILQRHNEMEASFLKSEGMLIRGLESKVHDLETVLGSKFLGLQEQLKTKFSRSESGASEDPQLKWRLDKIESKMGEVDAKLYNLKEDLATVSNVHEMGQENKKAIGVIGNKTDLAA